MSRAARCGSFGHAGPKGGAPLRYGDAARQESEVARSVICSALLHPMRRCRTSTARTIPCWTFPTTASCVPRLWTIPLCDRLFC